MKPSLIIHGGAGLIAAESIAPKRAGIGNALAAGWKLLTAGSSALDAVEAAIAVLEDDPAFNAGKGANLNLDGYIQLDAILMDGNTLKAGAVAAVERIVNPIHLVRRVLERSEHVLLAAAGAEKFAVENGMSLSAPEDLITDAARSAWRKCLESPVSGRQDPSSSHGTVGAVALDSSGALAAGTSTGGTPCKYPGRVGDSPLIGCGCYAESSVGGVSCTGHGEAIMKIVMAKMAVDLLRTSGPASRARVASEPDSNTRAIGLTAQTVADQCILHLANVARSTAGLILLDAEGRPAAAFNTPHMSHGFVDADGSFRIFP